jgi:NAD-dependent deacetylase sirtuin 4
MSTVVTEQQVAGIERLVEVLRNRRVVVLAGAGCSTESGIPDYRGPEGSLRTRKPIQYQEFVRSEAARIRYWARSTVGWPRVAEAQPNAAHRAFANLEAEGVVAGIITQNVDGLHHKAGSRRVVELHGSLARVCCLDCGDRISRNDFQARLLEANPRFADWLAASGSGAPLAPGAEAAPDGDAEIPASAMEKFTVPACHVCAGVLKPDVVFFGENVPRACVDDAWALFAEGEVLLVAGSSLTVYSGRRFIYRAEKEGVPIAVINLGPTRADEMAVAKVEGRLGDVLPVLAAALART